MKNRKEIMKELIKNEWEYRSGAPTINGSKKRYFVNNYTYSKITFKKLGRSGNFIYLLFTINYKLKKEGTECFTDKILVPLDLETLEGKTGLRGINVKGQKSGTGNFYFKIITSKKTPDKIKYLKILYTGVNQTSGIFTSAQKAYKKS